MSVDLASIRQGIANVISTIPQIKKVNLYGFKGEAINNQPFATISRSDLAGPAIHAADTQLGGFDHLITWTIRVYSSFANHSAAQQMDDILAAALLDAFDGNMLIDANGPGVVDESRIPLITPFVVDEDHAPYWVTEATLQTFVITTL